MQGLPQTLLAQGAVDGARWQDRPQQYPDRRPDGQHSNPHPSVPHEQQARLARIVEAKIIPRLVLAHPRDVTLTSVSAAGKLVEGCELSNQVDELVELVVAGDIVGAVRLVETLCWMGVSLEAFCAGLLTPAARRLGELWTDDRCDFAQITIAQWRLQQLLHELGPQFPSAVVSRDCGLRALLIPAPGEEHTLGLAMVTEFFRRSGWRVAGSPPASLDELREMVRIGWFDVAGLAISCESRLRLLAQSIRALRLASRNPDIRVLVGGPLFLQRPELVAVVGADATATDARHAPAQAEQLVALLAGPSGG